MTRAHPAANGCVRTVLTGQSAGDLSDSALAASWFAASILRAIDAAEPGSGFEMLQDFGLVLAQFDA